MIKNGKGGSNTNKNGLKWEADTCFEKFTSELSHIQNYPKHKVYSLLDSLGVENSKEILFMSFNQLKY